MITSFSHVYLPVPDVGAAVRFYTTHLGFRLLRGWRTGDGPEAAYGELGGVLLEISQSNTPPDEARDAQRFGLVVDDLAATLATLRAAGVEVAAEPFEPRSFEGRQAVIRDPFGYRIALREWHAPDGPTNADWQPTRPDVTRTA